MYSRQRSQQSSYWRVWEWASALIQLIRASVGPESLGYCVGVYKDLRHLASHSPSPVTESEVAGSFRAP